MAHVLLVLLVPCWCPFMFPTLLWAQNPWHAPGVSGICAHSSVTLQSTTASTTHQHMKGDFGFFQDSIFSFQYHLAYYLLIAKYYFSSKGESKPCWMKPLQNLENCTQLSSSQVAHYQKIRKWSSMILQGSALDLVLFNIYFNILDDI